MGGRRGGARGVGPPARGERIPRARAGGEGLPGGGADPEAAGAVRRPVGPRPRPAGGGAGTPSEGRVGPGRRDTRDAFVTPRARRHTGTGIGTGARRGIPCNNETPAPPAPPPRPPSPPRPLVPRPRPAEHHGRPEAPAG